MAAGLWLAPGRCALRQARLAASRGMIIRNLGERD